MAADPPDRRDVGGASPAASVELAPRWARAVVVPIAPAQGQPGDGAGPHAPGAARGDGRGAVPPAAAPSAPPLAGSVPPVAPGAPPRIAGGVAAGPRGPARWSLLARLVRALLVVSLLGLGAVAGVLGWTAWELRGLDLTPVLDYRPLRSTVVLAAGGAELGELHRGERRRLVELGDLPDHVWQAFVAAEDGEFFRHAGADPLAIARATWANVSTGRWEQGASTITQQVIKRLILGAERTLDRKRKEIVLATRLEQQLGKRRILEIYVNDVYLGHGRYGVDAAARYYFERGAGELDLGRAAVLAALPKAPGKVTPYSAPAQVRERRDYVLRRMAELGYATEAEIAAHVGTPLPVVPRSAAGERDGGEPDLAPELVDMVEAELVRRYGADALGRLGATVTTTIDLDAQTRARVAVRAQLARLEQRQGYGGPADPGPQAAFIATDVASGDVLALVGGREVRRGDLNRALVARRQPGSAFKPLVYGAALAQGALSTASLLPAGSSEEGALPRAMRVRQALAESDNAAALATFDAVGPAAVHEFARALGIASPLIDTRMLALGVSEVTPMELATVYLALARGGRAVRPRWIRTIERDGQREVIEPEPLPGSSPELAALLTSLLESVVREGTAHSASDLGRALAGKTGTTNAAKDAWFAGYTARTAMVAWVGFDRPRSLGSNEGGGRTALPIVEAFVRAHERTDAPDRFKMPTTLDRVTIDTRTGEPACVTSTLWVEPGTCGGLFALFCSPASHEQRPTYLRCGDPRGWADEWFLRDTPVPPAAPELRALANAPLGAVEFERISLFGASDGELGSALARARTRDVAPWQRWRERVETAWSAGYGRLAWPVPLQVRVRVRVESNGELGALTVLDDPPGWAQQAALTAIRAAGTPGRLPAGAREPQTGRGDAVLRLHVGGAAR